MAERLAEKRERHLERSRVVRVAYAVAASIVLAVGLALLLLPGPGWAIIFIGLAMLALEFAWAERLLARALDKAGQARDRASDASTAQKVLGGLAIAAAIAACVVAALLWDIPLLPV
jgi:uncharacterized protein (TIGR02611 family)